MASLKDEISEIKVRYAVNEQNKNHIYTVEDFGDSYCAVVPEPMVEEFNFDFEHKEGAWAWLVTARYLHPDGKNWQIDPSKKQECARHLFEFFREFTVNESGEIEEDFLHFDKGTVRNCILSWLETEFDVQIADFEGVA